MSPTIRSIAEAANVSRGTVDRVLNGRPGVHPGVRERVQALAAELGYKPNLAGRSLALHKHPLRIGFILHHGRDPLFQEMRQGVDAVAEELAHFGVHVDCRVMERVSAAEQLRCLRALVRGPLAGLAICPVEDPAVAAELSRLLRRTGIPLVTCNSDSPALAPLCYVGQDLGKSGQIAGDLVAKLLRGQGQVLVVTGRAEVLSHQERLDGFCQVLREEFPGLSICHTIPDIVGDEDAFREVKAFLAGSPRPDAIFITGLGGGGVGRALRETGLRDIRVVCYDRRPETEAMLREGIVDFTLTQDPFMQGYQPVKLLFDYLVNGNRPESRNLFTRIEIVTRKSL